MQIPIRRTWWVVPIALLFGAALTTAPAGAAPAARLIAAADDDQIPPEQGPSNCNGGPQELSLARMNDTPSTIGETGTFVPLVSSAVPVTVPNNDTDQFVVRFSAEAVLTGQPVPQILPADLVQLQIVAVGGGVTVPLAPLNDPTFTTGVGGAHALQACRRLGAGNYTIGVRWRVVDVGMNNNLTATLDDWLLSIEQND
jgi:hypothetical protein